MPWFSIQRGDTYKSGLVEGYTWVCVVLADERPFDGDRRHNRAVGLLGGVATWRLSVPRTAR